MLNQDPFYFSILRKLTAAFGTIFNDMSIPRFDSAGNTVELIHVPLSYAPKEKVLARLQEDPNLDRKTAVALPRMSFELVDFNHDGSRAKNPVGKNIIKTVTNSYTSQFNPVPYNFHFKLWVYAKQIEDGNKIVEQIIPFFKPDFTMAVELIPEMNVIEKIPVILEGVNLQDTYDGAFADRRAIITEFDFNLKSNFYGPIANTAIIKFAKVNIYAPNVDDLTTAVGNSTPIDRVTSQPGLTANGQPTSNISLTIPYQQINSTDNYDYINIIAGDLTSNTP